MEFGLSPIPGFLFLCPFLRFGSARTQFPAAPNFFIFSPSSSGVSAALLFLPSCSFSFPSCSFSFWAAVFLLRCPVPCCLFPLPSFLASFPVRPLPVRPLSRTPFFRASFPVRPLPARPLFARLAPSFPAYTLPGLNPLPSLSILQPAPRLNGTAADGTVRNGVLMSAQSFSVPLQAHPGRFMLPNC